MVVHKASTTKLTCSRSGLLRGEVHPAPFGSECCHSPGIWTVSDTTETIWIFDPVSRDRGSEVQILSPRKIENILRFSVLNIPVESILPHFKPQSSEASTVT